MSNTVIKMNSNRCVKTTICYLSLLTDIKYIDVSINTSYIFIYKDASANFLHHMNDADLNLAYIIYNYANLSCCTSYSRSIKKLFLY